MFLNIVITNDTIEDTTRKKIDTKLRNPAPSEKIEYIKLPLYIVNNIVVIKRNIEWYFNLLIFDLSSFCFNDFSSNSVFSICHPCLNYKVYLCLNYKVYHFKNKVNIILKTKSISTLLTLIINYSLYFNDKK